MVGCKFLYMFQEQQYNTKFNETLSMKQNVAKTWRESPSILKHTFEFFSTQF